MQREVFLWYHNMGSARLCKTLSINKKQPQRPKLCFYKANTSCFLTKNDKLENYLKFLQLQISLKIIN